MSARVEEGKFITENLQTRPQSLPFASIVVPVYNAEKLIGECIESLLKQDFPKNKYEIIIVDNNSTDATAEVIKRYPVKYVSEGRIQSSYAARNAGVKISKGEALVFFDADQVAEKSWLRKLLAGWEKKEFGAFGSKRIGVSSKKNLAGRYWEKNENTRVEKFFPNKADSPFLKLSTGTAAYREELFKKLGGFDSELFSLGDYDLSLRLQKELGYMIKYNYDAIIYHKERINLRSILKREYRFGFGRYLFECKHPEFKIKLWISFVKAFKRMFFGSGALIIGLFRPLKKSRKEHLFTILFDIAMHWANFLGRLQGFLTKGERIFPAHW